MTDKMQSVHTLLNEEGTNSHNTSNPATNMSVSGLALAVLEVSGTEDTMKLEPQVSIDGEDFTSIMCTNLSTGDTVNAATGIADAGLYTVPVSGFKLFRVWLSSVGGNTELTVKAVAFPK